MLLYDVCFYCLLSPCLHDFDCFACSSLRRNINCTLVTCVFYIHIQHFMYFIFPIFYFPFHSYYYTKKDAFLIVIYVGLPCSTFYTKNPSEWPRVNVHEFLKSPQTKVHFLFPTTPHV